MKTSHQGINFIKTFESFSSSAYICPAGYATIGYGHLIKKSEIYPRSISQEEALELLESDVVIAENSVLRLTGAMLNQNQFDMLVSFTFNLGSAAYQRSTLRSKVNREEHESVPLEFMRWVHASGKVLQGLVKRRKAEAEIYCS